MRSVCHVVLLAIGLIVLPACTPATSASLGTIRGTVTAGPVCPVVSDPPDPACADRIVQGAEIAVQELARALVVCDDWEQASHGGELAAAVEAKAVRRDDVLELGDVLAGDADWRREPDDVTLFDSTGLAIQDLAIARAALARAGTLDLQQLEL